jgi:hypothetical protein
MAYAIEVLLKKKPSIGGLFFNREVLYFFARSL